MDKGPNLNSDLKEEAVITLEILKRLDKPSPPTIEGKSRWLCYSVLPLHVPTVNVGQSLILSLFLVIGHNSIKASWEEVPTKSGFTVRYQLFDCKCVCVCSHRVIPLEI